MFVDSDLDSAEELYNIVIKDALHVEWKILSEITLSLEDDTM